MQQAPVKSPLKVKWLDHIALLVHDVDASIHFYKNILGLPIRGEEEVRAGTRRFAQVRAGDQVIDLVPSRTFEPAPKGDQNQRGLTHFCLVVEDVEMDDLIAYLKAQGVEVHGGPTRRGQRLSVDCYDPDNYFVELSTVVREGA
jgi:catechol 2,3-dioxygenase-like lactoylglutathione lyase family enzyme